MRTSIVALLLALTLPAFSLGQSVDSTEALVAAVTRGAEGSQIQVAAGTYQLSGPLRLKSGMKLVGAGIDKTIITHDPKWKPSTKSLPDPETKMKGLDSEAYLIRLEDKSKDVEVAHLTLRGPAVHGGVFGFAPHGFHLHDVKIQDVLASGLRTLGMKFAKIHDCQFVDAGGRWKRGGIPGDKGGLSSGAMFLTWVTDSEISHNRIWRTKEGRASAHFGIKGRQGRRNRIHHNTIDVNFSIEFPFEGDEDMEIDHNVLRGAVSIPKYAGGKVPASGRTFHIHHNYFTTSYAIEFVRNGVEVDHNLFDFDVDQDGGNLVSGFGKVGASGPAKFHNNLISNPGRGVIWINEPYNEFEFRNNHVITRTTATPRKEGLLAFNSKSDFSKFRIANNVVQCIGLSRPLLRHEHCYAATVENNQLTNVADANRFDAPDASAVYGLEAPLKFECGVHGEFQVDQWEGKLKSAPAK